jgi:hypothetical protein
MPEKEITVTRTQYKKKLVTRPVTFVCTIHPGGPIEVTEERYPGPTPKYCLACRNSGRYARYKAQKVLERYHRKQEVK